MVLPGDGIVSVRKPVPNKQSNDTTQNENYEQSIENIFDFHHINNTE